MEGHLVEGDDRIDHDRRVADRHRRPRVAIAMRQLSRLAAPYLDQFACAQQHRRRPRRRARFGPGDEFGVGEQALGARNLVEQPMEADGSCAEESVGQLRPGLGSSGVGVLGERPIDGGVQLVDDRRVEQTVDDHSVGGPHLGVDRAPIVGSSSARELKCHLRTPFARVTLTGCHDGEGCGGECLIDCALCEHGYPYPAPGPADAAANTSGAPRHGVARSRGQ